MSFHGRNVVEDSPRALVLEEKLARWIGGAGLLVPVGAFCLGELPPDRTFILGDTTVNAWWFVGLFALGMLSMLFERDRIVFDAANGTVERTLRLAPWRTLRRPVADIERVEVSKKTSTMYGEDNTDHFVHIVFRDGRKLQVSQSGDGGFISALAGRIEEFRR